MISVAAKKLVERIQESGIAVRNGMGEVTEGMTWPTIFIEEVRFNENKKWNWNHHFSYVKNLSNFSFEKKRRERHFDLDIKIRLGGQDEFELLETAEKLVRLLTLKNELVLSKDDVTYSCLIQQLGSLERPEEKKLTDLSEGIVVIRVEMVPLLSEEPPIRGALIQEILIDLQPKDLKEEM